MENIQKIQRRLVYWADLRDQSIIRIANLEEQHAKRIKGTLRALKKEITFERERLHFSNNMLETYKTEIRAIMKNYKEDQIKVSP